MPRTGDLFTGWYDNQRTQQREYWNDGVPGRYAHRRCIEPTNPWPELRAPWGSNPDVPHQAAKEAA